MCQPFKFSYESKVYLNVENVVFIKYFATILLVFSVGCTASQNTYLSASVQVNGVYSLHKKPSSDVPVPQQP
jgi:hypothetical protein